MIKQTLTQYSLQIEIFGDRTVSISLKHTCTNNSPTNKFVLNNLSHRSLPLVISKPVKVCLPTTYIQII